MTPYIDYPSYSNNLSDFERLRPEVSVDLEFQYGQPKQVSLCAGGKPVSVPWTRQVKNLLRELGQDKSTRWVGHNFIGADAPILREQGVDIPLDSIDDTMSLLYLGHSNLAGAPGISKNPEGDDSSPKGVGLLGLWSLASLYTTLPAWKTCRDGLSWGDDYRPAINCEGPCPKHDMAHYNALDAMATDLSLDGLRARLGDLSIPQSLVTRVNQMLDYTRLMQEKGVSVDREQVAVLEAEFQSRKDRLFPAIERFDVCGTCNRMKVPPCKRCSGLGVDEGEKGLKAKPEVTYEPFNPRSSDAIINWFKSKGVYLDDTSKDTIESLARGGTGSDEADEIADRLYQFKDEGKGLKPWFDGSYFGPDNRAHPRFNPCGSGPGRWSSASPNFQNVPKGGFGKLVRRVVVPRDPGDLWIKADYGQLELRMALWYAFVHTMGKALPAYVQEPDMFTAILDNWSPEAQSALDHRASLMGRTRRDVLKSIAYGYQLFEGITTKSGAELETTYNRKAREKGFLLVYDDWKVMDEYVCFTGVNLARRLFGDASQTNRIKALELQAMYAAGMPELREWQKTLSRYAEQGFIQTASGRVFELYGDPKDRLKLAATCMCQGGGADYAHEGIQYYYQQGEIATLQVHDELDWEKPRSWTRKDIESFCLPMSHESKIFPGFTVPVDIEVGNNWCDVMSLDKWFKDK